jgi:phenylalanyl-tRNA synthetase beta chain
MKVLLSWMQEFAPLDNDPDLLAEVMIDLGMVVEDVVHTGPAWDGIVVAEVLDLRPHPEADRIQLVDVDAGDGQPLQVCCGAFNMKRGDLVPLATVGTTMPGGLEIGRRKLRGEWSNGMLCSPAELELAGDADGIMILDPGLAVGQPLAEALGADGDVLFDLDIEANRPDALSVAGVARDVAAQLGVPFTLPSPKFPEADQSVDALAAVDIEAPDLCSRFGVRVLHNVSIGESPPWMAARLVAAGMRPINSIVDISNYVMLELGQPNHTYDLELVPDGRLGVRMGRHGETLVTLDDVERTITTADGLIVDAEDRPIGLAGVMGGASTEISESTTSVLLEAAVWDRMTIARTSRRLGLRSEASTRFERGVDPHGIELALDRFVELAVDICGATVASGRIVAEGNLEPPRTVRVRTDRVNSLLNLELTTPEIADLLDPIGFTTRPVMMDGSEPDPTPASADALDVTIPTWRPDSAIEVDVIEEIGRHHGYDKSGRRVPTPTQVGRLSPTQVARRRIRRALLGDEYSEAMPLPFLAPDDLAKCGLEPNGLTLSNPLVAEESVLRTSLLPGLLKAVVRNQSHRNGPVRLYELGRVYEPSDAELPHEHEMVAACASGFGTGRPSNGGSEAASTAAYAAVRSLYRLSAELGLRGLTISNQERPGLHPTRAAAVHFRGQVIGEVGEIDPRVLDRYDIDGRVAWLQLELAPLVEALNTPARYKPISLYPSSDIDLAFVTPDDVAAPAVAATQSKTGGPQRQAVELFAVFRSPQLGENRRSLAYRLRFQAPDRTLTDEDVAELRQRCIDAAASVHGAELR